MFTFIQTKRFTERFSERFSDEDLGVLEQYPTENPEAGAIVVGSGGVRKCAGVWRVVEKVAVCESSTTCVFGKSRFGYSRSTRRASAALSRDIF